MFSNLGDIDFVPILHDMVFFADSNYIILQKAEETTPSRIAFLFARKKDIVIL